MLGTLAARRAKAQKVELTDDEKFIIQLQTQVGEYMNIWKAASFGQVKNIEKALEEKVNADAYEAESGLTPLMLAARSGHVAACQMLVEKGRANVNITGQGGMTALHHACRNDHLEVVNFLVNEAKANLETEDDCGNSALIYCSLMGNLKCLELLVSKGATLDRPNRHGCTPFLHAVLNCRTAIVDFFLKKNINVNATDVKGNTALHYASSCGYVRLCRTLLLAGVKPEIENSQGYTAADIHCANSEQITNVINSFQTQS